MKAPLVLAVLHRRRETHMTGGASAERSSSELRGRGDEVAVSSRPGTRLAMSLASRPHPADSSGQPLDREEGPRERSWDALRRSDYGSIVPKEKVRTSVPGGCWMCSTTFVYVRDVRRTVQFPFGHSVFALGGVGGGMFGEKVIWPL